MGRDNMTSYYMMFSEILILIQMFICFVVACIWIPFGMNEYQIPIQLRATYSNVFLDYLKLRLVAFSYFIILSGSLPHFIFYVVDERRELEPWSHEEPCLHTVDETKMSMFW